MNEIRWKPSRRQKEALKYLLDHETTELFYGGGAGGGKSYLGCAWTILSCLQYPGIRGLMGRAVLKSLKESTLLTFFEICRDWGLKKDKDFKYNSIEGTIKFSNGSEVYLKDLFAYPSDPEFDSLGSTEYTFAFLDEVSQISEKAKNIVMSRLRFKLDAYDLIPKLLMASNPSKNFAYREYWQPWNENKLPAFRKFVPALVDDNPFISDYYKENLKKLDKNSRERLLYGNWNYDDDPSRLFDYDKMMQVFNLGYERKPQERRYISCDVARFGPDETVIIVWRDFCIYKIYHFGKRSTKETADFLKKLVDIEGVPRSNIVVDEDGVGGGVVDQVQGCKGFINNSQAKSTNTIYKKNYANLKTECYFLLAKYIDEARIGCEPIDIDVKKRIIEDLEQIKWKDPEKDNKISITPKEEIKENLGKSPDFGDALMLRMVFAQREGTFGYIAV